MSTVSDRLQQALGELVPVLDIVRGPVEAGFAELAGTVFAARRQPPATAAELRLHAENAAREHAAMRRLALPRHLLGRLVEVVVVLDRAALLEERGQSVLVAELFEPRVTPRNTVLAATAEPRRLPACARA
jgi:hypothetical protein